MAAILGLGMTHVPLLAGRDQDMTRILRRALLDPDLPARYRTPEGWPEPMRREWAGDEGLAAAGRHREALLAWCRKARRVLDDFAPDLIVVWGDDQYENFKEDIIPPFCVLAYDAIEHRPWAEAKWGNVWDEPKDTTFVYKGHRPAAKRLASGLLDAGFDVSYAYRPLHHPLGHAFMNTLLFLDYDRQGFPYPVIPFQVNCYGRRVIAQYGSMGALAGMSDAVAMLRPRPRHRARAGGEPLARGAHRLVELVARVPDAQAPPAASRRCLRPRALRGPAAGRLRDVAQDAAGGDRGQRSAGDAQLDVPGRRHGRARAAAERDDVHRELDLQLEQGVRDLPLGGLRHVRGQ